MSIETTHFITLYLLQSCEEGIVKLRTASNNPGTPIYYIVNQVLYPLVQGCESKDVKIIKVLEATFSISLYFVREKNKYVFAVSVLLRYDAKADNAAGDRSEGCEIHYGYFMAINGVGYRGSQSFADCNFAVNE